MRWECLACATTVNRIRQAIVDTSFSFLIVLELKQNFCLGRACSLDYFLCGCIRLRILNTDRKLFRFSYSFSFIFLVNSFNQILTLSKSHCFLFLSNISKSYQFPDNETVLIGLQTSEWVVIKGRTLLLLLKR